MIQFVNLKAQYAAIKPEMDAAVLGVLASGHYVLGPQVSAFEDEFARFCRAQHAVGVSTGTSALHLALLAGGVGPGDEVITTPFTFVATVAAIRYTGARPVFVDIAADTLAIDVERIEAAITPRTRAIVPIHLYGQPADMDPIVDVARRHDLLVVEDAAQAHGAEYKGRRVGSIGDIGCFSFYPGKNLGAYGEGGAVVTNNPALARRVALMRNWGAEQKYVHELPGYNYRLEEMQAAILRVKLRYLEGWTGLRRRNAAEYDRQLAETDLRTPFARPDVRHVYHIYAVRSAERDALQRELLKSGIQTGIHYPVPVHLQPIYADLGHRHGDFPNAEQAADEVLSLPMYAELTASQIGVVAGVITRRSLSLQEA